MILFMVHFHLCSAVSVRCSLGLIVSLYYCLVPAMFSVHSCHSLLMSFIQSTCTIPISLLHVHAHIYTVYPFTLCGNILCYGKLGCQAFPCPRLFATPVHLSCLPLLPPA
ncbi:hypothetical protein AMECASPLE_022980 [Ameca splendens]|uniref:Secreted protein n=1 Tax=Ameca splendens TaxID=208324 RepID=A0ABV1ABB8_9TELE